FKRIARASGRLLPLAIWQDTTTLYVTIYELSAHYAPKALVATGVIQIHLYDFLQQLFTLRSLYVAGPWGALCNIGRFGCFFAKGVLAAYGEGPLRVQ
ncbi:MAG: hypothetical protein KDE54_09300, partial [Caldilineaceae bacterium]|nr:hypothetical protein [Caldilineaceae bacterium]